MRCFDVSAFWRQLACVNSRKSHAVNSSRATGWFENETGMEPTSQPQLRARFADMRAMRQNASHCIIIIRIVFISMF